MTDFLIDTLVWTGVLIALVLVLRRPVARHFGARTAYALWLLPMLRLVFPPLVLPAWMNASEPAPVSGAMPVAEPVPIAESPVPMILESGAPAAEVSLLPSPVDFILPLMAVWLIGAAIFLVRRFALYFDMRRQLLEGARPVGDVGQIRIVETPEADGPVAFGVLDKVIALPLGMMSSRDREARDLAIAHELAHHRGGDLLVNFLVQPLFALHWFNPLGWAGWRALRRDQEAACDARVIDSRPREERARYADIIAEFATGARTASRHALAAPMACPVLGDKSIVHRLRSLTMSDISRRRRLAGRALLAGGALALPLTASISYAAEEGVALPLAITAQAAEPVEEVERVEEAIEEVEIELEGVEEELAEAERAIAEGDARVIRIERRVGGEGEGERTVRVLRRDGREMTPEERAELQAEMAELRRELGPDGELGREMRVLRERFAHDGEFQKEMKLALKTARENMPHMIFRCDGSGETVRETVGEDGKKTMVICRTAALGTARAAIANARRAVEIDRNLTDQQRAEALQSLDEAVRELDDGDG